MARLGELLVAADMLTIEQVEQGLRAQVVWGGRLGTNLVELKLIALDELTRILGRQHGLPAALARHFDKSDPELQAAFPAELAQKYSVIPLVYFGAERKIAVACIAPLDATGHAEVVAAFGIEPANLIVSIAAELRIRYHLERVYQIPRGNRFLRSKGPSSPPFPHFDELDVPNETDPDAQIPLPALPDSIPVAITPEESPKQADADDLAILIDAAVDAVTAPASKDDSEPHGRDRRRYVKALSDVSGPVAEDLGDKVPLGRIPIRRVALTPTKSAIIPVVEDRGTGETIIEAMRSIRRSPNRDRVADLVMYTMEQFIPASDAAIMLVVRGQLAIGWKWFTRTGLPVPEVAMPMDQAGLVPMVIERKSTARCDADDLEAIDLLLLRALGKSEGDLVVVPVAIGDRVMCLIATATASDAPVSLVEEVATAAGTGFARLIRAASR